MEMKAVTEYEAPNYATYEEKKNKIFRFVMNMPKVSIGMLVLFLINSNGFGVPPIDMNPEDLELAGSVNSIVHEFLVIFQWSSYLVTSILLIFAVINAVKLKKIEAKEEIKKRKKIRNVYLILAIVIFIIPLILRILYEMSRMY